MTRTEGDAPISEEENERRRQALPAVFLATPHVASLGVVIERYEPDDVLLRLPFREDLTNDGSNYHGGVVATALDTAGGLAAWSGHDFSKGLRAATVSLSVQYLAGADGSDLWAAGRAVRRGRELVFCEMEATDTAGRVLAHALQTYRLA